MDSGRTSPCGSATTSSGEPVRRRRGAQPGNTQALKTGFYTAENQAVWRYISQFCRHAKDVTDEILVRNGHKPLRRKRRKAPAA